MDRVTLEGALRTVRVAAGLEQVELAKRLGVSQAQVCRVENGKGRPSLRVAAAWAEACAPLEREAIISLWVQSELAPAPPSVDAATSVAA